MSYDFNFVDNVLFNWRHRTLDGGDQGSRVNCINNYYEPAGHAKSWTTASVCRNHHVQAGYDGALRQMVAAGNIVEGNRAGRRTIGTAASS